MRVLIIANTFPPGYTGGAEVANYHTCRGLMGQGIDCSVLVLNNRFPVRSDESYHLDEIPVRRIFFHSEQQRPLTDIFDRRIYRTVLDELRRLKPDLVHFQNVSGATLAPYLACRVLGTPVVNTLHDLWLLCPNNMLYAHDGSFCPRRYDSQRGCGQCFRRYDVWADVPYRRRLFAALTSNVRFFIAPSQALIDRHVDAGYDPGRFRLVRLGFEEGPLQTPTSPEIGDIVATADRYHTVVFVGGGVEIKGAGVFLQAIPMMLRNVERLRIVVAGAGEERFLAGFRRYAPEVRLTGWVPFKEMRALFAAADLTVVPSVCHENSPVTIYENYQVGTPVLGSAFGGIPELIRDGETGYLFPVGNAPALAERVILHFAHPPHVRRHMRRACVAEVRTHLTLDQHVEATLRVYEEALRR